jgi:ubiquitin carboxyl-terminal hydrolase L5
MRPRPVRSACTSPSPAHRQGQALHRAQPGAAAPPPPAGKYAASEIKFNLMAMIGDRVELYGRQLQEQQARRERLAARLAGSSGNAMDADDLPSGPEALQAALLQAEGEVARWVRPGRGGPSAAAASGAGGGGVPAAARPRPFALCPRQLSRPAHAPPHRRLQDSLAFEQDRRRNWRDENIRRKHNYIPFLFNFLKVLAEKQQLKKLIDAARKAPGGQAAE